jgi:parallel beta-helix repeat protein
MARALNAAALAAAILAMAMPAFAVTLRSAYNAAGPGEGYDKLVVLDKDGYYTGGLEVVSGTCCIHGQRSTLDLRVGEIRVTGSTTLDIDHCIIVGGLRALSYADSTSGVVRNNTIRGNITGVYTWYSDPGLLVENNIIVQNSRYGIYAREGYEPAIQYNTVWANLGGDYIYNSG